MMSGLEGKTVLITGAAGAIGRACIETFLESGARIISSDLGDPPDGAGDSYVQADVSDRAAVDRAFAAAVQRFGRIDAAVLAAGVEGVVGPVEDISEADIDSVLAVNLKGSLFWMQSCLKHMKARGGGSIVALSSISGVIGTPSMAAYTISKHAVIGLVRAAALESGAQGVRVNAICPGPVESEMMRRLDQAFLAQNPERFAGRTDATKGLPMQRYVLPAEVARMAAFLCSDQSGSCHGGAYMVDGGFTAR